MMSVSLKIAVAESSQIIRSGLLAVLKRLPGLNVSVVEIADPEQLVKSLCWQKPDILIVNPALPGLFSLQRIRHESGCETMKCVALQCALADALSLRIYDETISLFGRIVQGDRLVAEDLRRDDLPVRYGRTDPAQTVPSRQPGRKTRIPARLAESAGKRRCGLRGEGDDQQADRRAAVPVGAYRDYPPPQHRRQIADTQSGRVDHLCDRQQAGRTRRDRRDRRGRVIPRRPESPFRPDRSDFSFCFCFHRKIGEIFAE